MFYIFFRIRISCSNTLTSRALLYPWVKANKTCLTAKKYNNDNNNFCLSAQKKIYIYDEILRHYKKKKTQHLYYKRGRKTHSRLTLLFFLQ